jgi:LysM repeat protein
MMSDDLLQRKGYDMRYTRLGRGRMGVIVVLMLLASLLTPLTALAAPVQHPEGNTEWVQVYTVQNGDTLAEIAWSFGVSSEALMQANSLRNPNVIYVGQQLIIPEASSYGTGGPQCDSYYTVRPGDTLSGIALYNGIDEYDLARANGLYDLNDIYVGQPLCIPSSGGENYPQQPQQPAYPQNNGPQNNGPQNNAQNDGCNPCGQPQNDGPKSDGPQRPDNSQVDGPRSDGPQNNGCDPCGQSQNDGPKNNGPENDGPQRPDNSQYDGPRNDGCDPCGQSPNDGPQNDGPQNNGPKNDGPQRPDDGCSPCDDHEYDHHADDLKPTEYWTGSYYNDKYFGEFVLQRQDLEVNFNWFTGSPFSDMHQDRFSVRWEKVEYFKGGSYRFYAVADDGVRVYVDDQLIIDHWVIQPATEYKTDLNLSPGPHKVVVEYYEEAEDAQIHVYWEPKPRYEK